MAKASNKKAPAKKSAPAKKETLALSPQVKAAIEEADKIRKELSVDKNAAEKQEIIGGQPIKSKQAPAKKAAAKKQAPAKKAATKKETPSKVAEPAKTKERNENAAQPAKPAVPAQPGVAPATPAQPAISKPNVDNV
jgi:hypothetical protein